MFTAKEILQQMQDMNAPTGGLVVMHTSMRAVGPVEGGVEQFLKIMVDYFTQDGGLFCVPAHTGHNIGKEITVDMINGDTHLGAFSTVALQHPDGVRSENPILSMVVFGDPNRVREFVKDEPFIRTATAPEGCYGKLFSYGGSVLLVGVAHNRNTYLHAVGEILQQPNRMADTPIATTVRRASGEIVHRDIGLYHVDFTDDISSRFLKYETAFRHHRCITDGFIGNAPAQLCDARKMKETVELIFRNNAGKDPLANEYQIPQRLYCTRR